MAQGCDYESQLGEAAALVAQELGHQDWRLVYQSRSGPPSQRWLGPDILDSLREIKGRNGSVDVLIAPIGFVSDHMEILFRPGYAGAGTMRGDRASNGAGCDSGHTSSVYTHDSGIDYRAYKRRSTAKCNRNIGPPPRCLCVGLLCNGTAVCIDLMLDRGEAPSGISYEVVRRALRRES